MSVETWGQLDKSQDDSEKIEGAIARLIAEHEADPDSHLGAGESLEAHRASEIIDHRAGSVVLDKYLLKDSSFFIPVNPASGLNFDNCVLSDQMPFAILSHDSPLSGAGSADLYNFLPSDFGYVDGDIVLDFYLSGAGSSGTWQGEITTDFAKVQIKAGYYRVGRYAGSWQFSDWVARDVSVPMRWRIHFNSADGLLVFVLNGTVVFSYSYTLDLENDEFIGKAVLDRGTSTTSSITFGNISFGFYIG